MPEVIRSHFAIGAAGRARGIRLAERMLGKIDLRGDPGDRAFMAAVGRVLDVLLPTEPCSSTSKGQITALWLGPDEWLITCPVDDVAFFANSLREALGDAHAAVTDVSDGQVAIRLAGPDAREVLAKGCSLDLHPRVFAPGTCARSLVAKATVLIHLIEDGEEGAAFDLHVGRSFAQYLWAWLEDAGREYGVQVTSVI